MEFQIETLSRTHFFRAVAKEAKLNWLTALCEVKELSQNDAIISSQQEVALKNLIEKLTSKEEELKNSRENFSTKKRKK
eukprot:TRINITY_DN3250_c0_g1_i1.p2 TRINITY_DN3250_c0_g1~~TRINITY_DN3250_c0_g1_i1.p2  ORF type:complete len:79 (+),score=11.93 TRINITY_DN3250_c0_g1_i1:222-458(+)